MISYLAPPSDSILHAHTGKRQLTGGLSGTLGDPLWPAVSEITRNHPWKQSPYVISVFGFEQDQMKHVDPAEVIDHGAIFFGSKVATRL